MDVFEFFLVLFLRKLIQEIYTLESSAQICLRDNKNSTTQTSTCHPDARPPATRKRHQRFIKQHKKKKKLRCPPETKLLLRVRIHSRSYHSSQTRREDMRNSLDLNAAGEGTQDS